MSDTCNAMLLVGPGHVECQSHSQEPFDHYSPEHGVGWSDGTPGAQPHTRAPLPVDPALIAAIQEQTGWNWSPEGQMPSGRDECRDLARAVLEAIDALIPENGAYSMGRGWVIVDGRRHERLCALEETHRR